MRALRTFTLTLVIALTGASTAYAEDKKPATLSAAESEQLLALFGELVDQAVQHAADCQALAGAVDGVVTRHEATVQMMWAAKKAKKTVPRDVQAQLDRRAKEMVGALRRCWDDDRVKKAFARMKVPEDKKQP